MASHYRKLTLTLSINAVLMFFITYAMIDTVDHFYVNINRVYMSLMMVAPMVMLMLFVMRGMYQSTRLNAIVICEQSSITDQQIVELCGQIVKAQKDEIAQMKNILERY